MEVEDLLPGKYYVKETGSDNSAVLLDSSIYEVTVTARQTGSAVAASATATAVNTLPLGSLKVTKAIQSTSGESIGATPSYPIVITVVLDGVTYYVQSADGKLGENAPETSLQVTAGSELSIAGLPYGSYTVTESNPGSVAIAGYSYVNVEGTSKPTDTADVGSAEGQADLVNVYERDKGSLSIKKKVSVNGEMADTSLVVFNV